MITKYIGKDEITGNDLFVISVPPQAPLDGNPSEDEIVVAHDYVSFGANCSFQCVDGLKLPPSQNHGASNWVSSWAAVQISIRDMFAIILPMLNSHKNLQPEHFAERIYGEDDKYWNQYPELEGPRYVKGDTYAPYAYSGSIIRYYKDRVQYVAYRKVGETEYTHILGDDFKKLKSSLMLGVSKYEENNFAEIIKKVNTEDKQNGIFPEESKN